MRGRGSSRARVVTLTLCGALAWSSGLGGSTAARAAEAVAGEGVRTLYLVRHGAYDEEDARDDSVGRGLVPIGVAQAKLVAERLRALPFRFDEIVASPLTRARETAWAIAEELGGAPVRLLPDLAECTPPTRRIDIQEREKPEDLAACDAQLTRLAATLLAPPAGGDRRELVVCHGNVIRSLVVRALEVDPTAWLGMSIGHASVTVLRIDARGSRVLAVGDVGHLPATLATGRLDDPDRDLHARPPGSR